MTGNYNALLDATPSFEQLAKDTGSREKTVGELKELGVPVIDYKKPITRIDTNPLPKILYGQPKSTEELIRMAKESRDRTISAVKEAVDLRRKIK